MQGLAGPVLRVLALLLYSSEFEAPVSVPVQEVLDLICRILSVSSKNIVSGLCLCMDAGCLGKLCNLNVLSVIPEVVSDKIVLSQYLGVPPRM